MPISASDFLREITGPLGIKDNELEAALQASGLKEVQLPDVVKSKFNEGYLTPERAASDEKVLSKARGAVYSMVEQRLSKTLRPKLKEDDQKLFDEAAQLFDKIDFLPKALDNIASAPADDVKKVEEKWRKTEAELRSQIKEHEDNFKKAEATKKTELESLQVDYALRAKLAGIEVAPEFATDQKKEFLANSTIDFLKRNFVLQRDDKNPGVVYLRKSVDGAIVDVYEFEGEKRQTPFTLDDVVKKQYEPFIKKNNADDGKDKNQQQQHQQQQRQIPSDKPLGLSDMIKQAAGVAA